MTDFQITHKDGNARRAKLNTKNGVINTPAFMPVGTAATVKAVFTKDLYETNSEIILGNTYHLMLRPGSAQIKAFGGLHKFMNWNKPILTDSGVIKYTHCQILESCQKRALSSHHTLMAQKYLSRRKNLLRYKLI